MNLTIEICCKKTRCSKGKILLQKSLKSNLNHNTLNQKLAIYVYVQPTTNRAIGQLQLPPLPGPVEFYFDYSDLQLFAIFIFEVYFSETYLKC